MLPIPNSTTEITQYPHPHIHSANVHIDVMSKLCVNINMRRKKNNKNESLPSHWTTEIHHHPQVHSANIYMNVMSKLCVNINMRRKKMNKTKNTMEYKIWQYKLTTYFCNTYILVFCRCLIKNNFLEELQLKCNKSMKLYTKYWIFWTDINFQLCMLYTF